MGFAVSFKITTQEKFDQKQKLDFEEFDLDDVFEPNYDQYACTKGGLESIKRKYAYRIHQMISSMVEHNKAYKDQINENYAHDIILTRTQFLDLFKTFIKSIEIEDFDENPFSVNQAINLLTNALEKLTNFEDDKQPIVVYNAD